MWYASSCSGTVATIGEVSASRRRQPDQRVAFRMQDAVEAWRALGGKRDHRAAASLGFLDVAQHLLEHGVVRRISATTGICSSMSAMGPCFISPAG